MDNSINENTTEPNLRTILDAVNNLGAEITEIKSELRDLNAPVTAIEMDMREVKAMQFVFENEIDRLLALSYKSLELSHENRADVRIMRKEIEAWTKTVSNLERQVA